MSKIDPDTALRVAREAAGISYSNSGLRSHAGRIYAGENDADPAVQAALLAYTHGTDLLKAAEPVEPPEVRQRESMRGNAMTAKMLASTRHVSRRRRSRARKQEGK